jgi:hypothetical protein
MWSLYRDRVLLSYYGVGRAVAAGGISGVTNLRIGIRKTRIFGHFCGRKKNPNLWGRTRVFIKHLKCYVVRQFVPHNFFKKGVLTENWLLRWVSGQYWVINGFKTRNKPTTGHLDRFLRILTILSIFWLPCEASKRPKSGLKNALNFY